MPTRLVSSALVSPSLAALLVAGCSSSTLPPAGGDSDVAVEDTQSGCTDAADNDGDGYTDCEDPDCDAFCFVGPEDQCTDGADNDRDGNVDCFDRDCIVDPACGVVEQSLVECSDGDDNDFDDAIDCADEDCKHLVVCGSEFGDRACTDLFDNDGDGDVDCDDHECRALPVCVAADREDDDDRCSDRMDNDGDGAIDCGDSDCRAAGAGDCALNEEPPLCKDHLDNDGDGLTDCVDPACNGTPSCNGAEATAAACSNGLDDESDGYTDCADADCLGAAGVTFCGIEIGQRCADGVDNDADGTVDCDDGDCTGAQDCAPELVEGSAADCSDSNDNDRDGEIDCADTGCASHAFCGAESAPATCSDGFDNDGDLLVDCLDRDCEPLALCTPEADCDDGQDDEEDGWIDCADSDCFGTGPAGSGGDPACGKEDPTRAGFCSDGHDNDADDLIDCADPGCVDAPACAVAVDEVCNNGTDDDGDGLVDCRDFDCLLDFDVAICDAAQPHPFSRRWAVHELQDSRNAAFPAIERGDPIDDPVRLRGVVVTFVDPADDSIFYVADPGDTSCDAAGNGCYRGLAVRIDGGFASGFAAGELADLAGLFTELGGESAVRAFAWQSAGGGIVPAPTSVTIAGLSALLLPSETNNDRILTNPSTGAVTDPTDDTLTAERTEGMLVRLEDVVLGAIDTDPQTGVTRSYSVYDVSDPATSFTIGTTYVRLTAPPIVGAGIDAITGILAYRRRQSGSTFVGTYRIEPRTSSDWEYSAASIDSDGDGLTDDEEIGLTGTDPVDFDTDRDEYSDGFEVGDPAAPYDYDGDGVHDALESFVLDRDGDDAPDERDAENLDRDTDDRDGDGVANITDPDDDGDGICDPGVNPATTSECTFLDGEPDNCPYAPEPPAGNMILQLNTDQDLVAEMAEAGIPLGDQYDSSNSGDACDWDADGDRWANPWDDCPYDYDSSQADSDGDGFGDACDAVVANADIQTIFTPFVCSDPDQGGSAGCDLSIEEVAYNLTGSSIPDLNRDGAGSVSDDELIELRNVSGVTLDLSGLELHDWSSFILGTAPTRHVFPAGTVLRHMQRVSVFGGSPGLFGSRVVVQAASSGSLGLSNSLDVVVLYDPTASVDSAFLAYGDVANGEPASSPNVSLTRYPDGTSRWISHPARAWSVGGQTTVYGASPGTAPDNDRPEP